MQWGDITPKEDDGGRYLEFRERSTKTRTGETKDTREFKPCAYENKENHERCPVELYLIYASHRPASTLHEEAPFFLAVNNMNKDITKARSWYKTSRIGINSIAAFMKTMAISAGLNGRHTNHSIRKTTVTRLLQAGTAPTLIQQVSGHKDVKSLSNYASASRDQIREMNRILSDTNGNASAPVATVSKPPDDDVHTADRHDGMALVPSSNEGVELNNAGSSTTHQSSLMMKATSSTAGFFEGAFQNCTFTFSVNKLSDK